MSQSEQVMSILMLALASVATDRFASTCDAIEAHPSTGVFGMRDVGSDCAARFDAVESEV